MEFLSDSLTSGFSAQGFQVPEQLYLVSNNTCKGSLNLTIIILHIRNQEYIDWNQN